MSTTFKPITPPRREMESARVSDLIVEDSRTWNVELIKELFWLVDHDSILAIPLGLTATSDKLLWHYEKSGSFTVRSSYRVAMAKKGTSQCLGSTASSSWWNKLRGLKLPNKVKICIWRAFHEVLPATEALGKRGVSVEKECFRCHTGVESVSHALLECPPAMKVRKKTPFVDLIKSHQMLPMDVVLVRARETVLVAYLEVFCMLMWCVWRARNQKLHGEKGVGAEQIVERAGGLLAEFHNSMKLSEICTSPSSSPLTLLKWKQPLPRRLKLNMDATVCKETEFIGLG